MKSSVEVYKMNFYPQFAKYTLAIMWVIFALAFLIMLICHYLGVVGQIKSSSSAIFVALGIPVLCTVQYFVDAVEKESSRYRVTLSDNVRQRLAPLASRLDKEVLIGSYPSDDANAFAISSAFGNKALIAFSTGLLQMADDRQLNAIAAHEIAHVRNGDSKNKAYILAFSHAVRVYPHLLSELSKGLLKKVAIALAITVAFFMMVVVMAPELVGDGNQLLSSLAILFPIIAWPMGVILIYFGLNHCLNRAFCAYSREREFVADAGSAKMTSPQDMISALSLLSQNEIEVISVFDTHPPLEDRKKRLERFNSQMKVHSGSCAR